MQRGIFYCCMEIGQHICYNRVDIVRHNTAIPCLEYTYSCLIMNATNSKHHSANCSSAVYMHGNKT